MKPALLIQRPSFPGGQSLEGLRSRGKSETEVLYHVLIHVDGDISGVTYGVEENIKLAETCIIPKAIKGFISGACHVRNSFRC